MLIAFFGHPVLYLAAGIGAIAVALAVVTWLVKRKRYKTIPLVAVPALVAAGFSIVAYFQQVSEEIPSLTSDLIIIIDDSRSMGFAEEWKDAESKRQAERLTAGIQARVAAEAPGRIKVLEGELANKLAVAEKDAELAFDADLVRQRLDYWRKQQAKLAANQWRPNRLQLVQALLTDTESKWVPTLLRRHEARIHFFHLDEAGRAVKVPDGDIVDPADSRQVEHALQAIAKLEPIGNHSRLGDAIRGAIEKFPGDPPGRVLVFSDGVNTRGELIQEAADFASEKQVQLLFVGIGNGNDKPEANQINHGQPTSPRPPKVLLVEGQPRYEYRYLKTLLEREEPGEKPLQAKVKFFRTLLLDADDDYDQTDPASVKNFPATLDELAEYDVLIIGDCDPNHKKLKPHLKNIVQFVQETGGSLVFLSGPSHNPHGFQGTPLAEILPVESVAKPPDDMPLTETYRANLTPAGRDHPIFRFEPEEARRMIIWNRLAPMYWCSTGYRSKPNAEVLAEHPTRKGIGADKHPLALLKRSGAGQCLFLGMDETWRWRRDNAAAFNRFWLQTLRYLAVPRSVRNQLWLDHEMPCGIGESIRIIACLPQRRPNTKGPVKVSVSFTPPGAIEERMPELSLFKVGRDGVQFEATIARAREGTYRFELQPDPGDPEPKGGRASVHVVVELPEGDSINLGIDADAMRQAAKVTRGMFFTLGDADQLLDRLPAARR
jgi:uncharacterized membrane protein